MNILISIGNSDDKLGQAEWAKYVGDVHAAVALEAEVIHGVWFSASESKYQNAGFSFESDGISVRLQQRLGEALERYRQDSIAVLAGETQFITRDGFGGPRVSETLSAEELANTVWIDNDGYPTEAALEAVATLPSPQVFEVMRRAWWMPTHGDRNDLSAAEAEMVGELEGTPWRLATGGWSGNEELIDAFQESWSWRWTWRLTAAGGLYIFDAPAKELPGGRVVPPEKDATIEALQAEVTTLRNALEEAAGLFNEMHLPLQGHAAERCTPRTDFCLTAEHVREALHGGQ